MKRDDLKKELAEIENFQSSETKSTERITNQLYRLNKLNVRLLRDFNEVTGKYNCRLLVLTVVIAFLTLVMVVKMLWS